MTVPRRSRLALSAALTGAFVLGGCAPQLRPPPAGAVVQPALEWRTTLPDTVPLDRLWWEGFGDPQLTALVERARAGNADVRIAAARVQEARATESVSRSLLLPSLEAGLTAGARREVSAFGQGQESLVAQPQFRAAYEIDLEWRQAEAEYQATAQLLPQIEAQIARQENALSVLTGEVPGDIVRGASLAALHLPPPPEVVPSELLRRRPDIAAAEYRLAATNAQMRAARARFMPTLGISATAGAAFSDLLADPVALWSIGGSVLAPIFNGGRLQAQVDVATAQRDQAAFAYRGTVLNAFREVEDRLALLARLSDQKAALEAQRTAVADAVRHAQNRYRAGYTPYIEQVDAQRSLLAVELSLVQLRADQLNAVIGLYQAAGGAS